jgi:Putative metallopeptidase
MRSLIFGTCLILSPMAVHSQSATLSQAAQDAFLHVVAHEIGHAVLREFDLPILGPEEDIADDFATVYLHAVMPDLAEAIITARAKQNLADGEGAAMFSEYRGDMQRAGRIVCILYGLDPERYAAMATEFGMDDDDADTCSDMAPEVARSWRRIMTPYLMPEWASVTEVRIEIADTPVGAFLRGTETMQTAEQLLARIDWHSLITLQIEACDDGAEWSRNGRTITVCDAYLARFDAQLSSP